LLARRVLSLVFGRVCGGVLSGVRRVVVADAGVGVVGSVLEFVVMMVCGVLGMVRGRAGAGFQVVGEWGFSVMTSMRNCQP
ncbi:MAG: hypothetical protein ACPL0F_07100, partial [bacterium]